jgi:deferrochelatase/peroxidase EfeB
VGLLFMAYNATIGQQFKFTQQVWANNKNFPVPARTGSTPSSARVPATPMTRR